MSSKERIGQMHNCFLFCSHPKEQNEPIILHWHRWLEESFCYLPKNKKREQNSEQIPNRSQLHLYVSSYLSAPKGNEYLQPPEV